MIPVTKPFKTPLNELNLHLNDIWNNQVYTNNGPKVQLLENKLKEFLDVSSVSFVSNGTIALQLAIKALDLKGEIITTPFSYVATTSSIIWEGCKPVFVDIDKNTLNIDPKLIENQITSKTSAILATHVFGNPCDIDAIDTIAKKFNLKVIYDGAHAFGVKFKGESIFNFGDLTTCSTHATKIFHTIEGGFISSKNMDFNQKIKFMRNFGHDGPFDYATLGINGKNSELHAAVGLVNLKYFNEVTLNRKKISNEYYKALKPLEENRMLKIIKSKNYSYFPVLFNNVGTLIKLVNKFNQHNIHTRRYFYPSLSSVNIFNNNIDNCPISKNVSKRTLCLPLYYGMPLKKVLELIQ